MNQRILFFALTLLLSACGPAVHVMQLGPAPQISPNSAGVQIYTSPQAVERPYREFALITVDRASILESDQELIELLVARAEELGADGLILLSQEMRSSGGTFVPNGFGGGSFVQNNEKIVRGSAIIFTDKPASESVASEAQPATPVQASTNDAGTDKNGNVWLKPFEPEVSTTP